MIRDIVCPPCGQKLRKILLPTDPGEYVKFVRGKVRPRPGRGSYCNHCRDGLPEGSEAEALSIWTDVDPYSPWEFEYLMLETDVNVRRHLDISGTHLAKPKAPTQEKRAPRKKVLKGQQS